MYYYILQIYIPSQSTEWSFRPISTLQQKELSKVLLINNNRQILHIFNQVIKECADPKHNIEELTIFDKVIVLLKLRCESIGDTIDLEIKKDDKKYDYAYSIESVYAKFVEAFKDTKNLTIKHSNIIIECGLPSIQDEDFILNNINDLSIYDVINFCIKKIQINEQFIKLNKEEFNNIKNNLPAFLQKDIVEYIKTAFSSIQNIPIYSILDEEIKFSFNDIYLDYIKLLYKEDLYKIYQEIFLLTKSAKFTAEYVESMSPSERQLYITFLVQESQPPSSASAEQVNDVPYDSFMQQMGG